MGALRTGRAAVMAGPPSGADPTPNLTKARSAWVTFQTLWQTRLPQVRYGTFGNTNIVQALRKK